MDNQYRTTGRPCFRGLSDDGLHVMNPLIVADMTKKHSILNKTAGHCAYCGCQLNVNNMTRDHVLAKSRGGTSELDNLLPACRACNLLKGDDSLDSFRLRFFWDTLHPADLVTYDSMVKAISKKRFYFETH